MDYTKCSNEQLEAIYKQAEILQPINHVFLKEIRLEMYNRGIQEFHGVHLEELKKLNPLLRAEYDAWLASK